MKKPIQKKWWFWLIVMIIAGGIFGNKDEEQTEKEAVATTEVSVPAETKPETVVAQKSATTTEQIKTVKEDVEKKEDKKDEIPGTLGMTPDEFRKSFNKRSDELGTLNLESARSSKLKKVQLKMYSVYDYRLHRHHWFSKQSRRIVRDVMMIGQGNGTLSSGADIIISIRLVILATNADIPTSAVGDIMKDLGVIDEGVDWTTIDESQRLMAFVILLPVLMFLESCLALVTQMISNL